MQKILIFLVFIVFVVLVVYGGLTYMDDYVQPGRMRETPVVRPHEKELLIMEEGVVPFEGGEAFLRAKKAEDLTFPFQKGDSGIIEQGKTLYLTYCAQCHGKYHNGHGTVGQSFYPLPTDLRGEKVQSSPDGVLFKAISYGIPEGRQPPLATTIDVVDRWRIVAYLKSLGLRN